MLVPLGLRICPTYSVVPSTHTWPPPAQSICAICLVFDATGTGIFRKLEFDRPPLTHSPLMPAKAGFQLLVLGLRFRGNERTHHYTRRTTSPLPSRPHFLNSENACSAGSSLATKSTAGSLSDVLTCSHHAPPGTASVSNCVQSKRLPSTSE